MEALPGCTTKMWVALARGVSSRRSASDRPPTYRTCHTGHLTSGCDGADCISATFCPSPVVLLYRHASKSAQQQGCQTNSRPDTSRLMTSLMMTVSVTTCTSSTYHGLQFNGRWPRWRNGTTVAKRQHGYPASSSSSHLSGGRRLHARESPRNRSGRHSVKRGKEKDDGY